MPAYWFSFKNERNFFAVNQIHSQDLGALQPFHSVSSALWLILVSHPGNTELYWVTNGMKFLSIASDGWLNCCCFLIIYFTLLAFSKNLLVVFVYLYILINISQAITLKTLNKMVSEIHFCPRTESNWEQVSTSLSLTLQLNRQFLWEDQFKCPSYPVSTISHA